MTAMTTLQRLPTLLFGLLGVLLTAQVGLAEATEIPAELPRALRLDEGWKAQTGDDPAWASPDVDDSGWETVELSRDAFPPRPGWGPVVWYRLRLQRADPASPQALALWIYQGGASEIYLDGELVVRHGSVSADVNGRRLTATNCTCRVASGRAHRSPPDSSTLSCSS